jgi:hypothetical protein
MTKVRNFFFEKILTEKFRGRFWIKKFEKKRGKTSADPYLAGALASPAPMLTATRARRHYLQVWSFIVRHHRSPWQGRHGPARQPRASDPRVGAALCRRSQHSRKRKCAPLPTAAKLRRAARAF